MEDKTYDALGQIVGSLTFLAAWIWCGVEYGFLLGVGLGWLPSAIVAVAVRHLWPLALIAAMVWMVLV